MARLKMVLPLNLSSIWITRTHFLSTMTVLASISPIILPQIYAIMGVFLDYITILRIRPVLLVDSIASLAAKQIHAKVVMRLPSGYFQALIAFQ